MKKILSLLLALALLLSLAGCPLLSETTTPPPAASTTTAPATEAETGIREDGFYITKEDVALYIHTYGHLPGNYLTKSEANGQFGSYAKAMAAGYRVGGNQFYNKEGLLPKKDGRTYTECDIVAEGQSSRGAYRIVFSNDGLVYYTHDHYQSFELLYGEP